MGIGLECGINRNTKVWHEEQVNIYGENKLSSGVTVGSFVEIGPDVEIGRDTSIAAFCFIPSGVKIGRNCFIGPRVTFTNDRYPPSNKDCWEKTVVEDGAAIGAGSTILPGVTIGRGCIVGAGSTVTKDVAPDTTVCGNPAKPIHIDYDEDVMKQFDK